MLTSFRRIRCSHTDVWIAVCSKLKIAFCFLGFVKPSATLLLELTNPMLEISCARYARRSEWMSSIILFSHVREPLLIMSKRDFESVMRCMGTAMLRVCSSCERRA